MVKEKFCQNCNKNHFIVAEITIEELESMMLYNSRINVANSYINSSQNKNVIEAGMCLVSDTQAMQRMWWKEISEKYGFILEEKDYQIDFNTKEIYYI